MHILSNKWPCLCRMWFLYRHKQKETNFVKHHNNVADDAEKIATGLQKRLVQLVSHSMTNQTKQRWILEQTLQLETQSGRVNLKFDGLPETKGENHLMVLQVVLTIMNNVCANIPVVFVYRIKTYSPKHTSPRTRIVKFANFLDRERVRSKRRSPNGTNMRMYEHSPVEIERSRITKWPSALNQGH